MPLRVNQRPMDEWCSPPEIAEPLVRFYRKKKGKVALDPCSNDRSLIRARRVYTAGGLHLPWWWPEMDLDSAYSNPPFSRLDKWSEKLVSERERSSQRLEVTFLVPVATSTSWWRTALSGDPWLAFTRRLKFIDDDGVPQTTARFDTVLMFYGTPRRWDEFQRCFEDVIRCVVQASHWRFN